MALDGTMDGKEWLQHTEEEFIFNEALVNQKFNDVSEAQVEDDGKVSYGAKKRLERSKEVCIRGSFVCFSQICAHFNFALFNRNKTWRIDSLV
jgi:hypothetical protein